MKDENDIENKNKINETYKLIERKKKQLDKSLLKTNLMEDSNYFKIILKVLYLILFLFLLSSFYKKFFKYYYTNEINIIENDKYKNINKSFSLNNYFKINEYKNDIVLELTFITYSFSVKYNIVEVKYNFSFFDENNAIIKPSDLIYYYNLHTICQIKKIENGNYISSLANINLNKFFNCIEYININELVEFGILIYIEDEIDNYYENKTFYFLNSDIINYNKIYFSK